MTTEPHALYRFFAADGALLYVGITADPGARWKQHRATKPWWQEVANITVEVHPSKTAVLAAETAAILAEKPRYNIVHNRGGTSTSSGIPTLDRLLPVQVGDFVALGLSSGYCPVGMVNAVDDDWIAVRLMEFVMGELTDDIVVVRWNDVEELRASYREDATTADWMNSKQKVVSTEHLGDFQTFWTRARGWDENPLQVARREVLQERAAWQDSLPNRGGGSR